MSTGFRVLASAVAVTLMASAAALPAQAADKEWKFEITPLLWFAGIKGDAVVAGQPPVKVDVSFKDVVDQLDFAGAFVAAGQYGHFVYFTQVDYMDLGSKVGPSGNGTIDTKQWIVTGGVGYQFNGWKEGQTFDVLLGMRHFSLDNHLVLGPVNVSGKKVLNDPVVIVRPSFPLSERWTFNSTLSYGFSGDSKTTYELQPQILFQMSERKVLRFGYRKLHYETETSTIGNAFDLNFQGPFVGFGWTFGGEP
jgi:hypothetical protein